MRILIAHSFYRRPGGEDQYVRQQVDLLQELHQVELMETYNDQLRGSVHALGRMMYSPRMRAEVATRIESFRPDVVHLHNAYPALGPSVHLAAKAMAVPLVFTAHNYRIRCPNGLTFTEGISCQRCIGGNHVHAALHECFPSRRQGAAYAFSLWTHRFILSLQDKIELFIAPSEFVRKRLLDWEIEPDRVVTVRNFTSPNEAATSSPGEFGLYLGRLSSEKGVDMLLRSLRAAGDPPFVVAGDGPQAAALQALTQDLALRNTRFIGLVSSDEVPSLLRQARYVAMPSLWDETAGLAAMEAMAAGRPVVVSDQGGLPELTVTGGGVVFRAGDVDDCAGLIQELAGDETRCREMGERALHFAREQLNPDRHRDGLENAYQLAIQRYESTRTR